MNTPKLRPFLVKIKRGKEVRQSFEVYATDSLTAGQQHLCLKQEDEYLYVKPVRQETKRG